MPRSFSLVPFWPPLLAILCGGATAILHAAGRVMYPLAALSLVDNRVDWAVGLVGSLFVLRLGTALAVSATLESVRRDLYARIGRTTSAFPATPAPELPPVDAIAAQLARGLPWVEAYYCRTWPGLVGSMLAVPVVWYLAVREVGVANAGIALGVLLFAVAVSSVMARWSERVADQAWAGFQQISTQIEHGLRGRVELHAHQLMSAYRENLRRRVATWSRLDRRMRLVGALTGVAAPLSAIALGFVLARWLGYDLLEGLWSAFTADKAKMLGTGLLLAATLPLLFDLSRQIAQVAIALPHIHALATFFRAARTDEFDRRLTDADWHFDHVAFVYPGAEPSTRIEADFTWRRHEALALMGPNGCGKTTIALGLIGALKPHAGEIIVRAPRGEPRRGREGIAYLSQDAYFDDQDTVREAIAFAAPQANDQQMTDAIAELGGIEAASNAVLLERKIGTLSSGQRRLIAIARAFLRDAEMLILDEPEANLGLAARTLVAAAVRRAKSDRRVLLLTHDPDMASAADRVLMFSERGRLDERTPS